MTFPNLKLNSFGAGVYVCTGVVSSCVSYKRDWRYAHTVYQYNFKWISKRLDTNRTAHL